ncbi:MAG: glycoprotein endopeptidase [Nitrospirae bacterium]|nr:MAG: glycoprotein endopeptidase [Nitrospirota bacterium]
MKVLGIDTSTLLGGVALLDGNVLRAETRLNVKVAHSERLLGEIFGCLRQCAMSIDEVDVIAFAIGPGSFTGLRVGLSTVKGLSFAAGKRVVAVSTLEAFAWNAAFSMYPVCPLLDARRKEVYGAVYQWVGNGFDRLVPEGAYPIGDMLRRLHGPTLFLGEGAMLYQSVIKQEMGSAAYFGSPEMMAPAPAHVAWIGAQLAEKEVFADPITLVPRYRRRSEAEIKDGC